MGFPRLRARVISNGVCGRNREGDGGCGEIWYAYEIPETVLAGAFNGTKSKPHRKRDRKRELA
jgi:hypothetical protein